MAKKKKTFRPKPRTPKGFRDLRARDLGAERQVIAAVQDLYELYGFEALGTSAFEYADALGKFLPDDDRPNAGVFSLQDDDDQWMSLRYDLTAPLARFVAENYDGLAKPFRRYAAGPVWRNEKPGPGRYREFTQIDADTVGSPLMAADAEMITLFADCMEAIGLARGEYIIRFNNRKVLNGVLETIGVDGDGDADRVLTILRAIDKLDRLGLDGVRALLGEGRKDDSGDYTEGAKLSSDEIEIVVGYLEAGGASADETLDNLANLTQGSDVGGEGVAELREIQELLTAAGYGADRASVDPSLVRGLGYYTGPVYEAELTFEVTNDDGQLVRFGSVGGGGRYDDLVERFKGVKVPATGISVGVSRLIAALEAKGRLKQDQALAPVVVLALDKDRMSDSQSMVSELRDAGIRAEIYLGGSGMRAQMKYADKRGAPIAVIEGEDERERGEITLKDLELGSKLSQEIEDNKAWREDQPAQISIPRAELVAEVKKMLARHRPIAD